MIWDLVILVSSSIWSGLEILCGFVLLRVGPLAVSLCFYTQVHVDSDLIFPRYSMYNHEFSFANQLKKTMDMFPIKNITLKSALGSNEQEPVIDEDMKTIFIDGDMILNVKTEEVWNYQFFNSSIL